MNADFKTDLLCILLDCGRDDISMLENVQYELGDIIDALQDDGVQPTLNNILDEIFLSGRTDLQAALAEAIDEKNSEMDDKEDEQVLDRLAAELIELESLNPERDMSWHVNFRDSGCSLKNIEMYRRYIPEGIEQVEADMGFGF